MTRQSEPTSSRQDQHRELVLAILAQNVEDIRRLIDEGADVSAIGQGGQTVLHYAAANHSQSSLEIVRMILSAENIDVNARTLNGLTPLHYAAANQNIYENERRFQIEARAGRLTEVSDMLELARNSARSGNAEIVNILIQYGADVNAQSNNGGTPLHYAAKYGNIERIQSLLALGANMNIQDSIGDTPIKSAARSRNIDAMTIFLDRSSDMDPQMNAGYTWFHYAAQFGSVEVINMLVGKGFDINAQDFGGSTPLHLAVIFGTVEMVRKILDIGGDLAIKDNIGRGAIDIAILNKEEGKKITELLLSRGAVFARGSEQEDTPTRQVSNPSIHDANRGQSR